MLNDALRAVENVEIIIDDFDKRVEIFNREVVRSNKRRAHKTSEAYLTRLAKRLTWRLLAIGRADLVDSIIDEAALSGYDGMARDVELYKFYIRRMVEIGHYPEDPMGAEEVKGTKKGAKTYTYFMASWMEEKEDKAVPIRWA